MAAAPSKTFSAPPQTVLLDGLLFDMDGTIIDSTEAVVKHWHGIGEELGVDPKVILQTSHGRRSIDVLKIINPAYANWEYIKEWESRLPVLYGDSAVEIPGARSLLTAITSQALPWAIVTSGTTPLVRGWLDVLALPVPQHLVSAEDVEHGKPDPACYRLGLAKLGLSAAAAPRVLVLEDSPAGIRAGRDAGCKVLAVVTSHTLEQIVAAEPDWIVRDLASLSASRVDGGGVELVISNALC